MIQSAVFITSRLCSITTTVVAQFHQTLQHVEQLAHIVEVQAGGRLIEQIEGAAGLPLAQFLRQLDALRFAARKRGGRLAQVHVAQADIEQRLQLGTNLREVLHQRQRFLHRGVEHVGDRVALELHLQGFAIVAAAAADVASDVDVRQEIHFDALQPVALAGFAAAALHVEAEASRFVAALARFRQHGVEIANQREQAGVSGRDSIAACGRWRPGRCGSPCR